MGGASVALTGAAPVRLIPLALVAAFAAASSSARAAVVVLDFEDIPVPGSSTLLPGKAGPEYAANGFTLDNTGVVFGPSAVYVVGAGIGYASTAVYPQYNQPLEVRRADGAAFDFVSLDVTSDPQKKGGTGTLVGLAADGSTVGTVPFTFGTNPAAYTTVFGHFDDVVAVRVSFAGDLDAARGAIDNVTVVPEPTTLLAAAAGTLATRRRRRDSTHQIDNRCRRRERRRIHSPEAAMTVQSVLLAAICFCAAFAYGQAAPAGDRAGIGIAIAPGPNGEVVIAGVKPDGPAARAGVRAGDLVVSVENRPVAQIGFENVPNVVSGPAGSSVHLVVTTPGQPPRPLTIRREAGIAVGQGNAPQPNVPAPNAPQPQPSVPQPAAPSNPFDVNVGASAPTPAAPTVQPQQPGGCRVLKLRPVVIRDPAVNNVVACAPLVPDGWQARGEVVWLPEHAVLANLKLEITDPATGAGVRWLPTQRFIFMPNPPFPVPAYGNYQGKLWAPPPRDPAELVATFYANELPELRGLRPVAREDFQRESARVLQLMTGGQPRPGQTALSVRLRYRVEQGDRPWDEDVFLTMGVSPMQGIDAVSWFVSSAQVVRAPAGEIDRQPALAVVRGSCEMTPEWTGGYQLVERLFIQRQLGIIADTAALGRKMTELREEQQRLAQQVANERMASADARSQAFREVLGGVENFRDPVNNREVYLPAGYTDYFVNARGEYLITDTPNVDPNAGTTENWQKMNRLDPMAGHGGR